MARVLLLCVTPPRLSPDEACDFAWRELRHLQDAGVVQRVSFSSLRSTPSRWARQWDWLAEIHLERKSDCAALADSREWEALLGDLRLVGMRPVVLLADGNDPMPGEG